MSRLTELLRQARKADPQLGADLEAEVSALMKRRQFGLVFEQHQPEAVDLPGRAVRRGDKVRVLPPRSEVKQGDQRLWRVERIERVEGGRVAHLVELDAEEPETQVAITDDLVVVAEFNDRIYPGLVETGRVERGRDKPFHTVINAENYHALEMLTYTHRHSIDAIYIDPPYNTGARDWKYNNNYVEGDDDYRHSKWLAFMERRLEVARELLNPEDSVLIVTIDEKEVHRLALLLDQTFPEASVQIISTVISPSGAARNREFTRVNEFVLFATFGSAAPAKTPDDMLFTQFRTEKENRSPIWNSLRRLGAGPRRVDSPSKFYPVFVDPATETIVGSGEALPQGADRSSYTPPKGLECAWPTQADGSDGRWELRRSSFEARLADGHVRTTGRAKLGNWSIQYLRNAQIERLASGELVSAGLNIQGYLDITYSETKKRELYAKTVWNLPSHDSRTYGSWVLRSLLPNRKFPFPKSLYAVEDALRFFVKDKPDAVILDFFSGSGTTAHAVMRLNRQDGGRRRCISVTNNEVGADEQKALRKDGLRPGDPQWEQWGICDYITKPRVTAAITGRTPQGDPIKGDYKFTDEFPMADGFEENAAFFTLTYEAPLSIRHNRAFERIAPMLWMRAGSRGRVINDLGGDGWDVAEAYGVLENIDQMGDFVARVAEVETVATVFVVTDSDAAFQMMCRDLPERVTAVRLYESYLHNFMINRRAGA